MIVIGGSFGGFEAVQSIVRRFRPDMPAAVFIVLHIGPHQSRLAAMLGRLSVFPAAVAAHGQPIRPGTIHVAPPDRHLLLDHRTMLLSRGPRENWTRPAIDPLFRSAAQSFGRRAIGVVLTGRGNDGTAGLIEIVRRGGKAIVQDPGESPAPQMPSSAIRHVDIDRWLPLSDIPEVLFDYSNDIASAIHRQRELGAGR